MPTARPTLVVCLGLSLTWCAPGFAAGTGATSTPGTTIANQMPGSDEPFIIGLRRIGVIAGRHVACLPQDEQRAQIEKMSDVGMDLTSEYGLRVAFNFIGAAGYGSGLPVVKADCPRVAASWAAIVQKYGDR